MLIELMSKDKINSLYLSKSSIQSLINQLLTKIVVSVCIMCKKKGHWKMVCRSKKVNKVLTDDDMEELFLGEVIDAVEANQSNSWKADIAINDKIIKFKIDSGADVSVLPYDVYNKLKKQTKLELEPTNKVLLGPCNYKLNCIGKFKAKLSTNHKSVDNEVFVVKGLQRP